MPVFRFCFVLAFLVLGAAAVIKVFKTYKVNYIFIFEFDPHYKVTHV